jgi:uncharacterized repeat protein (TIGR04138 family)
MFHPKIAEVVRRDPRYAYEAYEFLFLALAHTQQKLGRAPQEPDDEPTSANHVSGRELCLGIRDFALEQYGLMARVVFHRWGVNETADVGELVFNLIEANLLSKTPEDSREDFRDVFDLDEALVREFRFRVREAD